MTREMTQDRWRRVKIVLEDALEREPEARAAFLGDICGGDETLRLEVESFLPSSGEEGGVHGFLGEPAVSRPPAPPDTALGDAGPVRRGPVAEVCAADLAPYTRLRVSTRTSEYRVVIVAPLELELLVQGGSRFPTPTRAWIARDGTIAVGRHLALQIGARRVLTTRVSAIEILS